MEKETGGSYYISEYRVTVNCLLDLGTRDRPSEIYQGYDATECGPRECEKPPQNRISNEAATTTEMSAFIVETSVTIYIHAGRSTICLTGKILYYLRYLYYPAVRPNAIPTFRWRPRTLPGSRTWAGGRRRGRWRGPRRRRAPGSP